MNEHTEDKAPPFEYDRIDDQVFIGTNACCTTHFAEKLLHGESVTADISLEKEHVDQPYGVEAYLWLPVIDHTPPTREQAEIGTRTIQLMLAQGKNIYIHCKNGHGRGPTLYASYLILHRGMSADEAMRHIVTKRPTAHFEDPQIAFLQALESSK